MRHIVNRVKFDEVQKHDEWKKICKDFNKPKGRPHKHVSSLSPSDLMNRVIYIYRYEKCLEERDIGLLALPGARTPMPNTFVWICGLNTVRK
jgi:hypothetical protein